MPRRIHTPILCPGTIELTPAQAHHLRDVLRLKPGDAVEAFDDAGAVGQATVASAGGGKITLHVAAITLPAQARFSWSVAVAVPKGPRADWMVEKLSELGVSRFIPLITARGVALPAGEGKTGRWVRLAEQAARQSGRPGVMQIGPMTPVGELIAARESDQVAWYFSTGPGAIPITHLLSAPPPQKLLLLIGPEGGWTDPETASFDAAGFKAAKLTSTILRVETAAIAAAAIVAVRAAALDGPSADGDHRPA